MARPFTTVRDPVKGLVRTIRTSMTYGVIVGSRGGFPHKLAKKGHDDIIEVLQGLGHNVVILSEDDTPNGAVETLADAKKCAALFQQHASEIDGIIVTLPNFGDEKAIANALRWAAIDVPVIVHAEPDVIELMVRGERRDSFCGKISVCNNLNQYNIPFTLTAQHTCPVSGEDFKEEIEYFTAVCRVVNGLKNARLGAIGARPAAFNTVRYSEKLLESAGVSVETLDLSEIIATVQAMDDADERVTQRLEGVRSYVDTGPVSEEGLVKIAKLAVAVEDWIEANDLDAIAFQCWSSIEKNLGVAPCAMLSMLSNNLIPGACEVDVTGALTMLALALASGTSAAILDWNNNYGDDPDKAVAFHCSNLPADMLCNPVMDHHFSENFERGCAFGTIFGRVASGPFTYARITTNDEVGEVSYYTGEGEFTDDPLETFGGYAIMDIPGLQELLQEICIMGYEHHFAATKGNVSHILEEAFEYLDINQV